MLPFPSAWGSALRRQAFVTVRWSPAGQSFAGLGRPRLHGRLDRADQAIPVRVIVGAAWLDGVLRLRLVRMRGLRGGLGLAAASGAQGQGQSAQLAGHPPHLLQAPVVRLCWKENRLGFVNICPAYY